MVNKFVYYILGFALALALVLGGIILYQKNNQDLSVIFLDVGQGDAILVQQGMNQILIDGGRSGKLLLEKFGRYIPFWDRKIEAVVATHPDQDHIGGLVDVLRSYKVHKVIKTNAISESQTYKALASEIEKEKSEVVEARKGLRIKFPNGAEAEIIYPLNSINANVAGYSNANSIVIKLNYGENSFLFTGDLPSEQELIIANDTNVKARVLKVSHHGSKYSSSDEFLESVRPEEAIISVGKNNQYGHPAGEIIERLLKKGIKIFRTDEMRDIIYQCKVKTEKCKVEFN